MGSKRPVFIGKGIGFAAVGFALLSVAFGFAPRQGTARFDHLIKTAPPQSIGVTALPPAGLPSDLPALSGWQKFVVEAPGSWSAWFDRRSGLPILIQGAGQEWIAADKVRLEPAETMKILEARAGRFFAEHPQLLGRWDGQLVLDRTASGRLSDQVWQLTFRQVIGGVPVEGARYEFQLVNGRLVAFGASRWAPVNRSPQPTLAVDQARRILDDYLGHSLPGLLLDREPATLHFVPVDPAGKQAAVWQGPAGAGIDHKLVWRFVFSVPGEPPTWTALIDAHDGSVFSFTDETRYERIKGSVYPTSDDQICPSGCAQPNYPMPFADFTENGGPVQYTGDHGLYSCSTIGSTIRTTLSGPYIRVQDNCGEINQTTACDEPLDLGTVDGNDCAVPPGSSPGNTHASRSSFYHLNRSMEKARAWLPDNTWLKSQLIDNVNIDSTCNAYWDGTVNFYKSGGGCRNTGEIAAVFVHEWGHGLDQNDGGGYDNPSEAYADAVALLDIHESCIGRGFYMSQQCSGYGDTCLACTGIRDQDWDKRKDHTPATPGGFLNSYCGGGGGPCGKEGHCESYVAGETVWDLAVRDLPASGVDTASAWQLAERLFYQSRNGSGGDAYNCSMPNSDGCGTASWFHKFRLMDDDDGDLSNGTPHAAAIFAAFDRHKIACGAAGDASNQNHSACPALARPEFSIKAGNNSAQLRWTAVPGAAGYRILRNDFGCERSMNLIETVPGTATEYIDDDISNNFTVYYRIQAIGSPAACESPVSECLDSAPQPLAGTIRFDQRTWSCGAKVSVRLQDGNVGAPTATARVWSDSEPGGETITLTEVAPDAGRFTGSISSTTGPAVAGDGKLSFHDGELLTVEYIDADDGMGGVNIPRQDTSRGDCVGPLAGNVRHSGVTDTTATILWDTDELSDSQVVWGPTIPPANSTLGNRNTTQHQVNLAGLASCTIYYYEVRSTDAAGNTGIANNGGQYFHFETMGDFGEGLMPCHEGRVTLGADTVSCSAAVQVQVVDMDLNRDPNVAETVVVTASAPREPRPEQLILTETGPNSSIFRGTLLTSGGAAAGGDGVIQIADGELVTVAYQDADDGTGTPRISYDTALADCRPARFTLLEIQNQTDESVKLQANTDEPTTIDLEWGLTPSLGTLQSDGYPGTSHSFTLSPLAECGRGYFRITVRDRYDNVLVYPAPGQAAPFHSAMLGGFWRDNFETDNGWQISGEWEIGAPQGLGGVTQDPSTAFEGVKVLGHDLSGKGAHPGDYERNTNEGALSKAIDARGKTNLRLTFRRWLNVDAAANAVVKINVNGSNHIVWKSDGATIRDRSWRLITLPLGATADNAKSLLVSFTEEGGRDLSNPPYSGWNIDRVVIASDADPTYTACRNCGGPPSFLGATSAEDNDLCANTGVTVKWQAAAAWGNGGGGTYSIYRDTRPDFTPGPANRIATGLTGNSFNDATAPADAQLYYIVRAETDEACADGPNNHGVTDTNTAAAEVLTSSHQDAAGSINTLKVGALNLANVRLTWNPPGKAVRYRVWRSLKPQADGFTALGETTQPTYDDAGAAANTTNYYYLVGALDPCGNETP